MSRSAPARVAVERADGQTRIRQLAASRFLRPRVLGSRDGSHHAFPKVALVAACASLLADDDLRLEIEVGPGASLELVEPSGTVVYAARGGRACWTASVRIADGGRLVWAAAPFVVAQGAAVHRHTGVELEQGAAALLRETLVFGRSGECGGALRSVWRATLDDRPLQVEDLDLSDPSLRSSPAVLGGGRVLGTVTLLGTRPAVTTEPHETQLSGPGALRRAITDQAHLTESALASTWARWHDHITA